MHRVDDVPREPLLDLRPVSARRDHTAAVETQPGARSNVDVSLSDGDDEINAQTKQFAE